MKTLTIIFIIITCLIANAHSQELIEIRFPGSYNKLALFGNMEVEIVKGEKEQVEIFTQGKESEYINTEIVRNTLRIRMTSELFDRSRKVKLVVTYNELDEISSTGGGDVTNRDTLISQNLALGAKSGGNIILNVDVEHIRSKVGQGGLVVLEGNAKYQNVTVSSGGTYSAYKLESNEASVRARTGGKARVNIEETLNARASTSGRVSYTGKAQKVKANISFGGEVVEATEQELSW